MVVSMNKVTFDEDTLKLLVKEAVELAVQQERESCAKVADEWAVGWPHPSKVIALDIRARGQA
jgi:hypothetical protein